MFPRVVIQLLLSVLLLVSQQLALAHGYTHVQRIGTEQLLGKDDGRQQTPAADSLCAQCLSADQLAYALGIPDYHFRVAGNATCLRQNRPRGRPLPKPSAPSSRVLRPGPDQHKSSAT